MIFEEREAGAVQLWLADNLSRLEPFLKSAKFAALDPEEQDRLRAQAEQMHDLVGGFDSYREILCTRIENF